MRQMRHHQMLSHTWARSHTAIALSVLCFSYPLARMAWLPGPLCQLTDQSEFSIQVTWSVLTNQRPSLPALQPLLVLGLSSPRSSRNLPSPSLKLTRLTRPLAWPTARITPSPGHTSAHLHIQRSHWLLSNNSASDWSRAALTAHTEAPAECPGVAPPGHS